MVYVNIINIKSIVYKVYIFCFREAFVTIRFLRCAIQNEWHCTYNFVSPLPFSLG